MSRSRFQHINYPIVLRMIAWLLLIEAFFMLVPMAISIYYGETRVAVSFGVSATITVLSGIMMTLFIKPTSQSMRKREGLLLTAVVWVFFSLFGMLPFLLSGAIDNVTDAFFETMAGFTTTGATVLTGLEHMPHGVVFWRSMMQWIGGMGIILFTLAVLPMLNVRGGVSLFNSEVTGITHEKLRPRVSQTAKQLWLMYLIFTAVMTVLLVLGDMGWFDALCYTMATVSTGGYTTSDAGLWAMHSTYINVVVMVFMFLCGINFTLIYKVVVRGNFRAVRFNDSLKWFTFVIILFSLSVFVYMNIMGFGKDVGERLELAVFDTLSSITSTGFASYKYENHGQFISLLMMTLMFFGGMAGSTSGGAKIDRMMVLIKNTRNELYRIVHSNAVTSVRVDGKSLPHELVEKVIAFLAIYVLVFVVVAVALTLMGLPIFDALFTSMSTLSNMGFGCGVTDGVGAYAALPMGAKWLLAFEMMVGRLELFTVLALFTRTFWMKD